VNNLKKPIHWLRQPRHRRLKIAGLIITLVAGCYLSIRAILLVTQLTDPRNSNFARWFMGNEADRQALITTQGEACEGAPFILPADGFIGLLYGDARGPYSQRNPHQGIDIFSNGSPGETPVYAVYDGYIRREFNWVSTLIQRVPDDPLQPGRQIWLYYTHLAPASGETDFIEPAFPPGAPELFVEQGTLLGYTGNYSGNPANPVGVHLHFSIIRDDRVGNYTNELEFANSIDPSPYLGMAVNAGCQRGVPACTSEPVCAEAVTP
jgi:murein DD-endopeptidase MepM/ murein hydrolase activator NlpD